MPTIINKLYPSPTTAVNRTAIKLLRAKLIHNITYGSVKFHQIWLRIDFLPYILQSFTIFSNTHKTWRRWWNISFILHSQCISLFVRSYRLMFHRKYTIFQWLTCETRIDKLLFLMKCEAWIVIHSQIKGFKENHWFL